MQKRSKQFIYRVGVRWVNERRGIMSIPGKPDIEVATPPEFRGHPGIWSPEDMFVASVNACIMTTFLYYAGKENLNFLTYESSAEGILERLGDEFAFSKVKVIPHIEVSSLEDVEKAKELVKLSESNCLISSSIKAEVEVFPEVSVKRQV